MSLFRVTVQYLITTWEDERSQTETPPQCLGSRARLLDWKDTLADQCLLLHARAIRMQQARPPQSHPRVGGGGGGPRSDQILANATVRLVVVSVAAKRARFVSTRSKTRLLSFFRLVVSRLVADVVTVQYTTVQIRRRDPSRLCNGARIDYQLRFPPGAANNNISILGTFTDGRQCSSCFLPCSVLCYGSGRRMEQDQDSFKEWQLCDRDFGCED
jgi:hypothetical protein